MCMKFIGKCKDFRKRFIPYFSVIEKNIRITLRPNLSNDQLKVWIFLMNMKLQILETLILFVFLNIFIASCDDRAGQFSNCRDWILELISFKTESLTKLKILKLKLIGSQINPDL